MDTIKDLLESGRSYTREELCIMTETDDRSVRREIRELRRDGLPVFGLPGGGYKLAVTEEEKAQMLHQIRGRAISRMRKAMQIEGQMTVKELLEAALEALNDGASI